MAGKNSNKTRHAKQGKKPSTTIKSDFGPFSIIPNAFIDGSKSLSPSAKWIYVILFRHYNHKTEACFPSWERLQELSGLSRMSVYRGIEDLIGNGWITKSVIPGVKTEYTLKGKRVKPKSKNQSGKTAAVNDEDPYHNVTPDPYHNVTLTRVPLNKSGAPLESNITDNTAGAPPPPNPLNGTEPQNTGGGKTPLDFDRPSTNREIFINWLWKELPVKLEGDWKLVRQTCQAVIKNADGDLDAAYRRIENALKMLNPLTADIHGLRNVLGLNTSKAA